MRRLVVVAVAMIPGVARADGMTVTGVVVDTHSRWVSDGSRIVTEATVRTPDGDVVVSQLGGSVDGLTMRSMPGPTMLEPGMEVAVAAHEDLDLAQQVHVLVDDVSVLSAPTPLFVRTGPTKAGHYLYWESGCIFLYVAAEGTREIPGDDEFPIVDQCIATWNDDTASCSYMKVVNAGPATDAEVNTKDQRNLLKFRDTSWCRPAVGNDPARCYDHSAAGITTATYIDDGSSSRDGAIVDADIEINGVDFAISNQGVTTGTASCKAELANTLTHELGHLHGLEHPCRVPGDPPRVDDQGNQVPLCTQTTDPKITEATMYNFQDCGETKKETLSDDDINAICVIYPTANDPKTCEPVGSGGSGCCNASSRPGTGLLLAALTGFVLLRTKKSRRRG
jgi:hypothetical protein